MKNIILQIFVFFSTCSVFAQGQFFNKKFTQKNNLYAFEIENTADDGFLIQGAYENAKDFLSKLDNDGNIVWAKEFKTKGIDISGSSGRFTPLNDGNFLIGYSATTVTGSVEKQRLVKMDNTMSNVIWTLEGKKHYLTALKALKNGDIICCAFVEVNSTQSYTVVFAIKNDGSLLWQKTFLYTIDGLLLYEIEELNDGQLLLVGEVSSSNQPIVKLCKVNAADGTIIWQTGYKSNKNSDYEKISLLKEDAAGNLYFNIETYVASFSNGSPQVDTYTGIGKVGKVGNLIWRKNFGDTPLSGTISTKPDGTFIATLSNENPISYFANIDTDGNISSAFKEVKKGFGLNSCFDKKGNLVLLKNTTDCDNINYEGSIEKRAANGQGPCSFIDNLVTKNNPWIKTNTPSIAPIANVSLGYEKINSDPLFDLQISTENQPIKCQDTVFVNRCEGEIYAIGSSKYSQDGIYIDTLKKQKCTESVITQLSFFKKNTTPIDTSFFCGSSINLLGNAYNQAGIYQKTFKNKLGCDSIVTLNLKEKSPKSMIDAAICEGKSYKIGTKEYTQAGNYQEVLQNKLGCDSTVFLQLQVNRFEVALPDSVVITEGEGVILNPTSIEKQVNFEWSPPENLSCANCPKTIAKPTASIDYTVKVTSKDACEASAKVNVKVFKRGEVFIPTAFSPDDNGVNDVFTVFGNEGVAKILDYSIFDRWGNHIFNQKNMLPNDPTVGWNGKYQNEKAPQGVYIYSIKIQMANGKIKNFSGDVILN